jgi:hypothetical protein
MNVRNSKRNLRCWRSKGLALLGALLLAAAATVGLLGLCSCATSEKGLAREQAVYTVTSNAVAVLQPVVQAAPAPFNTALGGIFALISGVLALWASHLQRSLGDLKKTNGNGTPPGLPGTTL